MRGAVALRTVASMIRPRGGGNLKFSGVLLAAVACACLLTASTALGAGEAATSASAKAKPSKACKKKGKQRVTCKKRKSRRASQPAGPRTVTLTWDSSADIDLKVFDLDGRLAGMKDGALVNGISGTALSGNDTDGFGPETFSDPSGRRVGYLVCYVSGPQANVTLTDSGVGGGHYTATLGPPGSPPDFTQSFTRSMGWGFLPIGSHC
jgi:hypothetical protein